MIRLDAINQMLAGIGEAPVSTEDSLHPDVLVASAILDRCLEKVLENGWWFNIERGITLPVSTDNKVQVPSGTLQVDPVDTSSNYVRRGDYLYDKANATYEIGESVKCDLVIELTFNELPISAQIYIAADATYQLQLSEVGDENKLRRLEVLRKEAWTVLRSTELRNMDYNALNTPTAVKIRSGIQPYR